MSSAGTGAIQGPGRHNFPSRSNCESSWFMSLQQALSPASHFTHGHSSDLMTHLGPWSPCQRTGPEPLPLASGPLIAVIVATWLGAISYAMCKMCIAGKAPLWLSKVNPEPGLQPARLQNALWKVQRDEGAIEVSSVAELRYGS